MTKDEFKKICTLDDVIDEEGGLGLDYTSWQRDLWSNKTIDEVFALGAEREKAKE